MLICNAADRQNYRRHRLDMDKVEASITNITDHVSFGRQGL